MSERFVFSDLRELFAKANEEKSGDQLAGLAARSERERVAAKRALADLPLAEIVRQPLIDPADDDVTRLILETFDQEAFRAIQSMTVGEFREYILDDATEEAELKRLQWAIIPEIAAAVAKIMSNKDLVLAAAKIRNVTRCRNTMGERGVLGIRVQPNHPADDIGGILLAAFEGLLYGCGDAVIGVNPASDSVETVDSILRALARLVDAYQVPTQTCCLAHISTQLAALAGGAPVDLLFQSVAGTEAANRSFGITLWRCCAKAASKCWNIIAGARLRGRAHNVMYFETGQGSALSAEAHHGVDQLTLEARAYGVARAFDPFLVNSVVGFIGPEYLYDERQIIRAGLEDHFMGKLLGLAHGLRRLLHESRSGRPELRRQSAAAPRRGGLQLLHGRALFRRRYAELPIHELSRRSGGAKTLRICGPRLNSWHGCSRKESIAIPNRLCSTRPRGGN